MYDKLYYIFPEKVTWTIRMSTHCQALFYGLPQNLLNTMVAISKKMSNLYVFVSSVCSYEQYKKQRKGKKLKII